MLGISFGKGTLGGILAYQEDQGIQGYGVLWFLKTRGTEDQNTVVSDRKLFLLP